MSALRRKALCFLLLMGVTLAMPASLHAQEQTRDAASLWADFNHYVLIARPDLAAAAGQALLQQADEETLLEVVENSEYENYENTLVRAARMEGVAEVAKQLERQIQQARIGRSRDEDRIARDIDLLDEGQRPYRNAVERLRSAGQYAVPQLLATLRDENQANLHPYVMSALVSVGRPAVAPLSQALSQLEPVTLGQVAQVLAQIGYPEPLPYLKQVIERSSTDPTARQMAERAFVGLAEGTSVSLSDSAAQLFLALGRAHYRHATTGEAIPGYDPAQEQGILWQYSPRVGLVPLPIPGPIYGDVLAMRASRQALEINPNLDQALSVYLMANLRRENRLPQDTIDPSYPAEMQPASFYAMLAGPLRLHDVLDQALRDNDAALALDAIAALATTAGTEALVNLDAARQPLLRALTYPDRRVRFRAAEALAKARPESGFPGAERVVPVLAEGVRQSGARYALVLARDQETLNNLLPMVGELGYEAFGGLSLEAASADINARPGVDLIVISDDVGDIVSTFRRTELDYKLAATPILAVVQPGQQFQLRDAVGDEPRISSTVAGANQGELVAAIEQAIQSYAGGAMGDAESEQVALTALQVLRDVALGSRVYNVADALPALVRALDDPRPIIVTDTGRVLALVPRADAQRALGSAAIEAEQEDVKISLLNSLAESATAHGNWLEERQATQLLELVRTSAGDVAIAAARAHGALSLPTASAVQLILQ